MKRIILLFLLLGNLVTQAQIKVGNNPTSINSSAVLDVESTTKGFLPPRMTTAQRNALVSPAVGLTIFNTDTKALEVNSGTTSIPVWTSTNPSASQPWYKVGTTSGATANTDDVFINGKVGIGTSTPIEKLDVQGNIVSRSSSVNGGQKNISLRTSAGLDRWALGMEGVETGSGNGGADFRIWNYADNGSFLTTSLNIQRSTGYVSLGTNNYYSRLSLGGYQASTSTTYDPLLTLAGTDGPIGELYHKSNGSSSYLGLNSNDAAVATATPIVLNENGGRVGIGTNSPTGKLHLSGDASVDFVNSSVFTTNTGTNGHTWSFGARPLGTAGDFAINDVTDAQTRMTIQGGTGNVGIGTINPFTKLHVDGGSVGFYNLATNASLLFNANANRPLIQFNGTPSSSTALVLSGRGSGNEDLTINGATGNVSIGTANTTGKLNVGGTTTSASTTYDALLRFNATNEEIGTIYHASNGTNSYLGIHSYAGGSDKPIVLQQYGGTVGIGTATPTQALDVAGAIASRIASTNGGTASLVMTNPSGATRWAIGTQTAESGSNSGGDFNIWAYADNGSYISNPMTIERATGFVGIQNTSPKATLHVGALTSASFTTGQYTYFHSTFPNGSALASVASSGPRTDASIISEGNIWCKNNIISTASMTFSDRRIKNIIGQSNASKDLDLLNKIRITDYRMKDVVMQGNKQYKKVIAQEIEEVYPEAVTQQTGFVPNIYQLADKVQPMGNNTYKVSFKKKVEYNTNVTGDLKLYDEKKEITAKVVSKGDNEIVFTTTEVVKGDKLFLFGEEVTDFRAVDYEALSTLNISATQELYREIQALKKQNTELMANITEMKKLESAYVQLATQVKEMQQVLSLTGKQSSTLAVVKTKE